MTKDHIYSGKEIKEIRIALGLSAEAVGKLAYITKQSVLNAEHEKVDNKSIFLLLTYVLNEYIQENNIILRREKVETLVAYKKD